MSLVAAGLVVAATAFVNAAEQQPDSAALSAVVSELRLLRQAVENTSQAQTQVQALAVYLSAQQARLLQVSAAADASRRHLDAVTREHRATLDEINAMTAAFNDSATPADRKAEFGKMIQGLRAVEPRLATAVTEAMTALGVADAAVQAEIGRWNEALNRLDQASRQ